MTCPKSHAFHVADPGCDPRQGGPESACSVDRATRDRAWTKRAPRPVTCAHAEVPFPPGLAGDTNVEMPVVEVMLVPPG